MEFRESGMPWLTSSATLMWEGTGCLEDFGSRLCHRRCRYMEGIMDRRSQSQQGVGGSGQIAASQQTYWSV